MFKVIYIYNIYSYAKVKQKSTKQKKKKEKKKAYVHVHPVPENKKTNSLGFTRFKPFTPPRFLRVLRAPCREEARRR